MFQACHLNRSIVAESYRSSIHLRVVGEKYHERLIESVDIPAEEHNKVFALSLVPNYIKLSPIGDDSNFTSLVPGENLRFFVT